MYPVALSRWYVTTGGIPFWVPIQLGLLVTQNFTFLIQLLGILYMTILRAATVAKFSFLFRLNKNLEGSECLKYFQSSRGLSYPL